MWEKVFSTLVSNDVLAKTQTGQPVRGNSGQLSFIRIDNFSSEDPIKKKTRSQATD